MYRYLLPVLFLFTISHAWSWRPDFRFAREFGHELGAGLGDAVAEGFLNKAEGPIRNAGAAINSAIKVNLPKIDAFSKGLLHDVGSLMDKSSLLFTKSAVTVAGLSAAWVIGLTVFKRWYNREKKYTLPRVEAAKSWDDIILPAAVRDELLQKTQFIKLVHAARKKSGCGLYRPLLLSGAHGTGKSIVAQLIARDSGIRVSHISSAHFMQYGADKCFSELYQALSDATNKNQCLIVIDNLDDFLTLHDTAFVNKFLQLIIEIMGVNKTHCMIIGITRDSSKLPIILKNCFEDCLELPLPDYLTRKALLMHYRSVYNEKYKAMLKKSLSEYFTDEEIDVLAQSSDGASGAKLESMVSESVIQATMS